MVAPMLGSHSVSKADKNNTNDTVSAYVNGLVSGSAWDAGVGHTGAVITYSFPEASSSYGTSQGNAPGQYPLAYPFSGLSQLSSAQISDVQRGFGLISSYTGLTFSQVQENPLIRASIRLANTSAHDSAFGAFPGGNVDSGDVFFGGTGQNPEIGNFDSGRAVLHEIGHALGLKHGEVVTPFGAMPGSHLSIEYSLMNYTTYIGQVGTAATEAAGSSPQSFMMDDIAALQYMYGANFGKVGQNVTYTWSPTTGEEFINDVGQGTPSSNIIFMTVWTEGANSTYDLSNFNGNGAIDLRPGGSSNFSSAQLANLGAAPGDNTTHFASGNVYNAQLFGTDTRSEVDNLKVGNGNDIITGDDVYNTFTLGDGNDTVAGGLGGSQIFAGNGTDILNGGVGNDVFTLKGGIYTVAGGLGTNTLDLTNLMQRGGQPFTITNNNGSGTVYEGSLLRVQFSGITSIENPLAPYMYNAGGDAFTNVPVDQVIDTEVPATTTSAVAPVTAESLAAQGGPSFISGTENNAPSPSTNMTAAGAVDLAQLLSTYNINPSDTSQLAAYFQVSDPGNDATVLFNPDPMGGGTAASVAVLPGVGPGATLSSLISDGLLKVS
jgi:serralysin